MPNRDGIARWLQGSIAEKLSRTARLSMRVDPIDVLNYAIEELGHTQAELAELLDSR